MEVKLCRSDRCRGGQGTAALAWHNAFCLKGSWRTLARPYNIFVYSHFLLSAGLAE
jgi:hypothetical protein